MATTSSKQAKDRQQAAEPTGGADPATLLAQYGCGPAQFSGTSDALYERHLLFDSVRDLTSAGARERFEAVARSVRDVLSQRWIRTEQTYERENPKRIYYLSMEYLIEDEAERKIRMANLAIVGSHSTDGRAPQRSASGSRRTPRSTCGSLPPGPAACPHRAPPSRRHAHCSSLTLLAPSRVPVVP